MERNNLSGSGRNTAQLFFAQDFFRLFRKEFYMEFFFRPLNPFFQIAQIFLMALFCLACQNLETAKQPQRAKAAQKGSAPQKFKDLRRSHSPAIDRHYFEVQADSAYLKAETAFFSRDNTEALKQFKKALLFAPDSFHLRFRLAEIYEREGLFAEALNHYKALSQKTEKNIEINNKITGFYLLSGLDEKAFKQNQRLLKQKPDNFQLWFKQAFICIHQKDWRLALKYLKQAENRAGDPEEKAQALISQARVFAQLNNNSKSMEIINRLIQLPIHKEEQALKIAGLYISLGKDKAALSYLESFQRAYGAGKIVSQAIFSYYLSSENWREAARHIQQARVLGGIEDHQYFFYMALWLMEEQKYDRALLFLKDLTKEKPENGLYLYLLAEAYEQTKEWQKALKAYSQVRSSSSHFLAAKLESARLLQKMGQKKRAFALLNQLSFPLNGAIRPQAVLLYAESLWSFGDKEKAFEALTRGLKRLPHHADLLFLRGWYFKQSGNLKLALKDMRKILKTQNNHEEALNFIASYYAEQKIHLDTAEKMARKALSLQPQSSYFLNTLGWTLFQKGNLKSALHYLKEAFSKNSGSRLIAVRLGKVYLQLKNFEKSGYFFKKALILEKNLKKHNESAHPSSETVIPQPAFMRGDKPVFGWSLPLRL